MYVNLIGYDHTERTKSGTTGTLAQIKSFYSNNTQDTNHWRGRQCHDLII